MYVRIYEGTHAHTHTYIHISHFISAPSMSLTHTTLHFVFFSSISLALWMFLRTLPGMVFSQRATWITPLLNLNLYSNVILLLRSTPSSYKMISTPLTFLSTSLLLTNYLLLITLI